MTPAEQRIAESVRRTGTILATAKELRITRERVRQVVCKLVKQGQLMPPDDYRPR